MNQTTAEPVPMIEAFGLTRYYGDFAAVRDVTFRVHRGEVVALLGPNGAGKSTTMKLLTGYLAPSAGFARIAGHDMSTDRLAGAAVLGYLPEDGPLYLDMTPLALLNFLRKHEAFAARGNGSELTPWFNCAIWVTCSTNRLASSPAGIGSGSGWLRHCFTSQRF